MFDKFAGSEFRNEAQRATDPSLARAEHKDVRSIPAASTRYEKTALVAVFSYLHARSRERTAQLRFDKFAGSEFRNEARSARDPSLARAEHRDVRSIPAASTKQEAVRIQPAILFACGY